MQRGVTVVLATVWLYASAVETASLNSSRFSLDQYSPLAPQHELYRVEDQLDWKDQSPVENQPFDLPINPRRSSFTSTASPWKAFEAKHLAEDTLMSRARDFSPLVEDKRHRKESTEQKIDDGNAKVLSELEDPFVADDTFQDQGPGSMEIYKLDLLREKSLLSPASFTRHLKGKGKTPKKTSQVDWKTKPIDYKFANSRMFHKQSNSFDDLSTEVPPNSDPFSIGGVPELQVGCEGLEASDKQKRSISPREAMNTWPGVTPISLDLDYDFSVEEEEMDELVRLKKLETTTKGLKQNRGDMDATRLELDKRRPEKLPVRGDLGKTNARNSTGDDQKTKEDSNSDKAKREADRLVTARHRRILWLDHSSPDELRVRSKRGMWGFGEDEGVVTSDELQTENQRRRQDYETRRKEEERRRLEEAQRRSYIANRTNSEVERIRQEYERVLEDSKRQEEERQRRLQERRRIQESHPRRYESTYEEERRRYQEIEARRRQQELDRRNLEHRRREWMLKKKLEEEERRRQEGEESTDIVYAMRAPTDSRSYYPTANRRQDEARDERLKEYVQRNRPVDRRREEDRRRQEEERKLREYIRRNQPVHVGNESNMEERSRTEESRAYNWSRYRGQSGRKDHGPSAPTNIDPRSYATVERSRERERLEQERLRQEALRREEETRRLQSRRYEEQRKRLQALDWERSRKELMEEQARRSQSGRTRSENTRPGYGENRRRQDASLIPANLVLNESRRELERHRMEEERRRIEDARTKEAREREQRARDMKEQWRRQEEARLNALPVSARIIVRPVQSSSSPGLSSRTGFDGNIDFPGANPYRRGVEVANFPAPATRRPPVQSPPACVWAVVQCCPINNNRLVPCFESMGCPGVNWDPNPCRGSITKSAREQISKFYADVEEDSRGL